MLRKLKRKKNRLHRERGIRRTLLGRVFATFQGSPLDLRATFLPERLLLTVVDFTPTRHGAPDFTIL